MMTQHRPTLTIPASDWHRWRNEAGKLIRPHDDPLGLRLPRGWSVSRRNPGKVLCAFPGLKLKPGFRLAAYQYFDGGNGNGFVYALPQDAVLPEPHTVAKPEDLRTLTKPPGTLGHFMEAIEGDPSVESYAQASLLVRELYEFGAFWHGIHWDVEHLVTGNPWSPENSDPGAHDLPSPKGEWHWNAPPPEDWRPKVTIGGEFIAVTFHTFSALGEETLTRHTDTYLSGSYVPRFAEPARIATGRESFIF